jgi:general stress protein 26
MARYRSPFAGLRQEFRSSWRPGANLLLLRSRIAIDGAQRMSTLPEPVEALLDAALVGELSVVDATGHPVTYPLIPLYDGHRIYLTSSTLFSRKLEHIKGNPKVSLSLTDPIALGGRTDRATIQGEARVIEEDPHGGWERLIPIWEKKEPSIVTFLKSRVALPLFFERSLIEITPRRVLYWADGQPSTAPQATLVKAEAA